MPVLLDCPRIECWKQFFNDSLPPGERDQYERHLESCPACQERLDGVEECEDALRDLGRRVGDPTAAPIDPTLEQFLDRLHDARGAAWTTPTEPADLYFLYPSDQEGVLGTLGEYEVQEVIGQGGMGVVLKAFEPALHRLVAIKVMAAAVAGSSTSRRRFIREAQAAAAVCHEHIVPVYGVHEADGLPYLVMQYVAGESLQTRLDRNGPLELLEIVRIGLQTASGLAAAHAHGLIHRDIKPANLLLEKGLAHVKITDFGLARMTDDVQLTQNGVVTGTPEYMAPEQARGETVDHRADLYSLGSVLYACCSGVSPFRGPTTLALLRQVSEQEPPPLRSLNPDVPVWLESLITRLMAKNPAERFQSAAEVAALVEGYLAHLQQPATVSVPELPLPIAEACPELQETGWGRGIVQRLSPRGWLSALVLLVVLGLSLFLLLQAALPPTPKPPAEIYQDFRSGQPLLPSLRLIGRDSNTVARPEDKGLRITLSPDRNNHDPVGVATSFSLVGDFVITATYELLSASRPSEGYGTGISLSVFTDPQRTKFAKVGRFQRAKEGSVYATEFWISNPPPDKVWHFHSEPTEAKSGQLRLVRDGSIMRFLVADGSENKFHQIDERNFGTEDLALVQLEVVDSGSSGNRVDARLVELKIRPSKLLPEEAGITELQLEQNRPAANGWLGIAKLFGLIIACALAIALGGWLFWRQSRRPETMPDLAAGPDTSSGMEAIPPPISFSCAACGKQLKAKAELAGKKVKCSQCDTPVLVPRPRAEATDALVKTEAGSLPISFSCAACGKELRGKAEQAGKKVKCSQCGKAVLMPMSKANKAGRISS
jgi:serine/threonine protein kinase/DNA-directed RNA polymerase subunit RPC12/RpoP